MVWMDIEGNISKTYQRMIMKKSQTKKLYIFLSFEEEKREEKKR